jgi:trypsin
MRRQTLALLSAAAFVILACGSPTVKEQAVSTSSAIASPVAAPMASESIVAPRLRPSGEVEFLAARDLNQPRGGAQPQLRGGRVAVSADWPASLYATFTTPRGTASCTAALIGPQAMLTAAHCVPENGVVKFTYGGQAYVTSCTQHPQYVSHQDVSADYALCKINRPFAAPMGFLYEAVNTSSMNGLVGKSIILTGFGCIGDSVQDHRTDGKYRIGINTIDETSASPSRKRGVQYYSGREDNNLLTTDDPALANLCPGDSGGPAFSQTGGPGQFTSRAVVGVNSRVFYTDATKSTYGSSLISATGGPDFRSWAEEWARSLGVAACGLNGSLTNCRS